MGLVKIWGCRPPALFACLSQVTNIFGTSLNDAPSRCLSPPAFLKLRFWNDSDACLPPPALALFLVHPNFVLPCLLLPVFFFFNPRRYLQEHHRHFFRRFSTMRVCHHRHSCETFQKFGLSVGNFKCRQLK